MVIIDAASQSLAGVLCILLVMCSNFVYAPFIRDLYDYLDAVGLALELLIFILGIVTSRPPSNLHCLQTHVLLTARVLQRPLPPTPAPALLADRDGAQAGSRCHRRVE